MLLLLFIGIVIAPQVLADDGKSARAAQVKAAYLYNFTRYVQWPSASDTSQDAPFVIGVIGDDAIGQTLDLVATTKKANGRTIVIRRLDSARGVDGCALLFISRSAATTLTSEAIQATEGQPILLVADSSGMAAAGATISFYLDQNGTVGFEINVDAAQRRGLRMDAKLLKLAKVVRDE